MAIDYIQINTGSLGNTINEMNRHIEELKGYMNQVYQEIQELDGMWDGEANLAFNHQFMTDHQAFLEMCDDLKAYTESLECAKNEYNKCENNVAEIVRSLRI